MHMSTALFSVHILDMYVRPYEPQYSLEDLEKLKIFFFKGQETADSVLEKDQSLTSSIYQGA